MNPANLIRIGLLGFTVISALAADPAITQEPLPPGFLLRRIPDFSSWRISFTYTQDKAKPAEEKQPDYPPNAETYGLPFAPRSITITRTKPRWLVVIQDVKGNTMEQCSDGLSEFVSGSTLPEALLVPRTPMVSGPENLTDYGRVDFPNLEWISKETYMGTQTNNERTYLVFTKGDMTAWIDSASRLPVLWKQGGETRTFEQLPSPSKMVDLPPQAAALAEAIKKDLERLKRPGPPKMLPPMGGSGKSSTAMPTSQPAQ